jgi:sec-independent protein translocase protein TatA
LGAITPVHLVIILVVALFVIGPRKLPETGAALGRAIRQFREAASGETPPATDETPTDPTTRP